MLLHKIPALPPFFGRRSRPWLPCSPRRCSLRSTSTSREGSRTERRDSRASVSLREWRTLPNVFKYDSTGGTGLDIVVKADLHMRTRCCLPTPVARRGDNEETAENGLSSCASSMKFQRVGYTSGEWYSGGTLAAEARVAFPRMNGCNSILEGVGTLVLGTAAFRFGTGSPHDMCVRQSA